MVIFSNQCAGKSREAVKPFRAIGSGIFFCRKATSGSKKSSEVFGSLRRV